MVFFNSLRIGTRLALGYGAVILLMFVMLGVTLVRLSQAERLTDSMLAEQSERLSLAREWRENIAVNSQRALAIGLSADESLAKIGRAHV